MSEKKCASCGKSDGKLLKCQCKLVSYCNASCQKKHWKTHKKQHKIQMKKAKFAAAISGYANEVTASTSATLNCSQPGQFKLITTHSSLSSERESFPLPAATQVITLTPTGWGLIAPGGEKGTEEHQKAFTQQRKLQLLIYNIYVHGVASDEENLRGGGDGGGGGGTIFKDNDRSINLTPLGEAVDQRLSEWQNETAEDYRQGLSEIGLQRGTGKEITYEDNKDAFALAISNERGASYRRIYYMIQFVEKHDKGEKIFRLKNHFEVERPVNNQSHCLA